MNHRWPAWPKRGWSLRAQRTADRAAGWPPRAGPRSTRRVDTAVHAPAYVAPVVKMPAQLSCQVAGGVECTWERFQLGGQLADGVFDDLLVLGRLGPHVLQFLPARAGSNGRGDSELRLVAARADQLGIVHDPRQTFE